MVIVRARVRTILPLTFLESLSALQLLKHMCRICIDTAVVVVPILVEGRVVAIIDVDCGVEGGFDAVDREGLERLAGLLGGACDW